MRAEKLQVICTFDPAVDTERMTADQMTQYIKSRDKKLLPIKAGKTPTVFVVREIPRSLMLDYVLAGDGETARCTRAFMAGVESVRNLYQEDGTTVDAFSGSGTMDAGARKLDTIKPEQLERFSAAEIMEIGAVAYYHAFLPRRIDDCLRAPLTSYDLWTRLPFRDADVSQTSAEQNSGEHSDPEASTPPTPSVTDPTADSSGDASVSPTPATAAVTAS